MVSSAWSRHHPSKVSAMQFDQFAQDYRQVLNQSVAVAGEDAEYFAQYKARYLARVLSREFAGDVLDFGCGVGLLSRFLKQHLPATRINGFDVSCDSINQIDPALARQGLFTSNSGLLAKDYSLIVVANVMHHIAPEQRQATVQDLARRLRIGGKLAIFEHNPANPITRWVVERCPFDKDVVLLPPAETLSYFADGGLRTVRRDYIVFMPHLFSWMRALEPWLAPLPMGAQYVCLGENRG
jgi:SAM-dependent methyltransferase